MSFFTDIYKRWNEKPWLPPMLKLMFHAVHIGGGVATAAFISKFFDMEFMSAVAISSAFFVLLIELPTAIVKKNWKDSAFDSLQYCFQWSLVAAEYDPILGAGVLTWFVMVYLVLLEKGW